MILDLPTPLAVDANCDKAFDKGELGDAEEGESLAWDWARISHRR